MQQPGPKPGPRRRLALIVGTLSLAAFALTISAQQNLVLAVNGQATQVPVIQINGQPYANVQALARVLHGSVEVNSIENSTEINLMFPESSGSGGGSASDGSASGALSKGFLKAGIEAMSSVREWHTALATAIRTGVPIAENWLTPYRNEAATNLRLASVAISNDSDRSAFQLLTNAFNNMKQLNDKYVAMRQSLSYIAPDSLQNDPLDQKLVTCGHSLAAMAASGQFQDDGSCQ